MMTQLRRLAAAAAFAALGATAAQAADFTVKIIGINDFHGNMQKYGYFGAVGPGGSCLSAASTAAGDVPRPCPDALDAGASPASSFSNVPIGGADYLAGYISYLKNKNPNSVVVSAGDMIGASPLVSAIFHDEGSIEVMNRMGMDFNGVGNHEFDEGQAELVRMQKGGCHPTDPGNSCKGASVGTPVPFEGARFKFLSANVVDKTTGKTLFPPYGIKSFRTPSGKIMRVGFIGMTLKDTPSIVTPSGVANLRFDDEVASANAQVPKLRALGVEAIVVLIHQGGFQRGGVTNDINGCAGGLDGDPIKPIVNGLDDNIDLVVSGHTHAYYNCQLATKNGTHTIPVTSTNAFARVITDIDMTLDDQTGHVSKVVAVNRPVARNNSLITPDTTIAGIVSAYNTLVSPVANVVIGSITADVLPAGDEMPAGDLIADAQLEATKAPAQGKAVIALMNRGGVRSPGFVYSQSSGGEPNGDVTYGEAFTVQPFGNILKTITLKAQDLKDVLEQQWNGCQIAGEPAQTVDRIMQISNGFSYTWDSTVAAAACNRVKKMSLNGTVIYDASQGGFQLPVTASTSYRVTVNDFMSSGGDGFTVLKKGTNPVGGGQDLDALVAYFGIFKAPNPPYDPTAASLNKPRIFKLP